MFQHACTHMQTCDGFEATGFKAGLAEDKELCWVFGASQPDAGDT